MMPMDEREDILADDPPMSRPRGAQQPGGPIGPQSASGMLSKMGASPLEEVVGSMAAIEELIKKIAKTVPQFLQIAKPFVDQARPMIAAQMADLAQGGIGAAQMGAGTPPPMAALNGMPPNAAPGAGVPAMPMPPMPM